MFQLKRSNSSSLVDPARRLKMSENETIEPSEKASETTSTDKDIIIVKPSSSSTGEIDPTSTDKDIKIVEKPGGLVDTSSTENEIVKPSSSSTGEIDPTSTDLMNRPGEFVDTPIGHCKMMKIVEIPEIYITPEQFINPETASETTSTDKDIFIVENPEDENTDIEEIIVPRLVQSQPVSITASLKKRKMVTDLNSDRSKKLKKSAAPSDLMFGDLATDINSNSTKKPKKKSAVPSNLVIGDQGSSASYSSYHPDTPRKNTKQSKSTGTDDPDPANTVLLLSPIKCSTPLNLVILISCFFGLISCFLV